MHRGGKGPLILGRNVLSKEQKTVAEGVGIRNIGTDLTGQTEAMHLLGPVASSSRPGKWGRIQQCFQVYSPSLQPFGSEFVWTEDFRLLFSFQ